MAVNLFHSFILLFLSLLFGIICFREVFQFKNITMIRLVMRHVGQQEKSQYHTGVPVRELGYRKHSDLNRQGRTPE